MRYLIVRVSPTTGPQWFVRYANVRNVIRFGLRHDGVEPGQFHIYRWPDGGQCSEDFTVAYKRA